MEALLIIIQLIFLEGILSLDNAAILGALACWLPDDRPVPFSSSMRFLALPSDYWAVLLGVAIGILIMRFAAGLFARMIKREPILETVAHLIITAIGIELLLSQYASITFGAWQELGI